MECSTGQLSDDDLECAVFFWGGFGNQNSGACWKSFPEPLILLNVALSSWVGRNTLSRQHLDLWEGGGNEVQLDCCLWLSPGLGFPHKCYGAAETAMLEGEFLLWHGTKQWSSPLDPRFKRLAFLTPDKVLNLQSKCKAGRLRSSSSLRDQTQPAVRRIESRRLSVSTAQWQSPFIVSEKLLAKEESPSRRFPSLERLF